MPRYGIGNPTPKIVYTLAYSHTGTGRAEDPEQVGGEGDTLGSDRVWPHIVSIQRKGLKRRMSVVVSMTSGCQPPGYIYIYFFFINIEY